MRVLTAAAPGSGLFLPTIPLAWALRSAGHEVMVANTGAASRTIAASGFSTVDVAPDADVFANFMAASQAINATPPGRPRPRRGGMGLFGEEMADGLLKLAESFRPDLVVSTLEQGAGQIVAAQLGIPYVEQSVRLAWAGSDDQARKYRDSVAAYLEPTRERLGVPGPWTEPAAVLDIRPPSLGGRASQSQWLMRYVPYNEGRLLPEWVFDKPERPRVCVTMGSVLGTLPDGSSLQELFVAAVRAILVELGELDIEIVVAMGDTELEAAGPLPDRVRIAGWVPLSALLPSCTAVVHHGGAGTSLTALTAGVPQLVLPRTADQPANAEVLAARGVGILMRPDEISPAAVRNNLVRLLDEAGFRRAAEEVRDEIGGMPSPAEVVGRLEALAG